MSEVLFQHEIDSLIESLASGSLNVDSFKASSPSNVKSFDFNRPNKFSKEQMTSLEIIHNSFARMLSNFMSAYLRSSIKIRVSAVEQLIYEDFVSSIPSPTLITVFSLEPLKRTAIFESNMQFVFPVMELMFGGRGNETDKIRALTDIEISVMRKFHVKVLEIFSRAWSDIFEIKTNIESMETNPRFSQTVTPKETVAVITLDTFIGKSNGLINICIPFVVLDPVISRLSSHYWLTESMGAPDNLEAAYLEKVISKVRLDVSAVIGETDITMRDFLQLQKGDVLQLDRTVKEDMDFYVDNLIKFKCKPGYSGNRIAVQISGEVEGD
ncbi:MAG: flagellar motor switch protein FliM [Dehalobacterium sp.]